MQGHRREHAKQFAAACVPNSEAIALQMRSLQHFVWKSLRLSGVASAYVLFKFWPAKGEQGLSFMRL